MRVAVLASFLVACGFSPVPDRDVQADAQPNGGPTIPLMSCHSQLADLRLCFDFEDPTLAPVIRDAASGHDASSSDVTIMQRDSQHAADVDIGAVIEVRPTTDLELVQAVTIEMWLRPDGTSDADVLLHPGEYDVGISGEALSCRFGGITAHATQKLHAGEWTHVACSYDGTTIKAYVDGDVSACKTATQTIVPDFSNTAIALDYAGGIDDVHVYARTLADTEIQGLAGVTSGVTSCGSD